MGFDNYYYQHASYGSKDMHLHMYPFLSRLQLCKKRKKDAKKKNAHTRIAHSSTRTISLLCGILNCNTVNVNKSMLFVLQRNVQNNFNFEMNIGFVLWPFNSSEILLNSVQLISFVYGLKIISFGFGNFFQTIRRKLFI